MTLLCLVAAVAVQGQIPEWETDTWNVPLAGLLLAENGSIGMDIFVPLGDHGLGGWSGTGEVLPGFPISASEGVSERPGAVESPQDGNTIVYADNEGSVHRTRHDGTELTGWPVLIGPNIVTGISIVDLDDDGIDEIAFGTADSWVHLLDLSGNNVPGWPVQLPSQLQWQPSQMSMGGGVGFGMICSLVSTSMFVLTSDGAVAPGWPVSTGFSSGSIPVSADLDSDGLADMVFATYNKRLFSLSTSGNILEGWPFFLDERSVPGAMAIGRLEPGLDMLQVAVSTIDSSVTLINGNGDPAGTWRWPNFTGGVPTAPIIARTTYGLAVIVGAGDGMVYAWSADGSVIDGYPFDFGQYITRSPAAGDIDGDGHLELVVLGRSGKLAAYTICGMSVDSGPWPQMLFDQGNSGSYGTSFLPRARVGDITAESTGDITLPYEIFGGSATDITMAYSTDAGFTWIESYNYTSSASDITWFSERDVPGIDSYDMMLKVTPKYSAGTGVSGLSNIFHLDNNEPPAVYMSAPRQVSASTYSLPYAVSDPEGDVIHLQSQFSIDGGENWSNAHLGGSTFEIAPWFYGEPVTWYVRDDLNGTDVDGVILRVRGVDADQGPWSVITDFGSGTPRASCGQIIVPESEASGDVSLGLRLSESDCDPSTLRYEFSTDGGESWHPATVTDWSVPYQGSEQFIIVWDSGLDLPSFEGIRVRFRSVAEDSTAGVSIPSTTFHLDNNSEPSITIIYPEWHKTYSGSVPVTVQLVDTEGDDLYLGLEYRLRNTSTWVSARGFDSDQPYGPESYRPSIFWDSTIDLPDADGQKMDIRFSVYDGDLVYSSVIDDVKIENR